MLLSAIVKTDRNQSFGCAIMSSIFWLNLRMLIWPSLKRKRVLTWREMETIHGDRTGSSTNHRK